ncbi:MAG: SWIM zinc finger family protein [Brachybacterium sp.]|nr:SWIM zinc finger family protein [Brachybacterium sp.]
MSIRLRSRRGAIGATWQGRALRGAAEAILGVNRQSAGRRIARADRVQWLDVAPGVARGDVLDDDGSIYSPRLEIPVLASGDRSVFLQVARAHPELPARLAAGDYPEEIEKELGDREMSLLPRDAAEMSHDCSCLDWPGPCLHVAALVYVLVEAVDETPAHLLTLRGLEMGDLAPDAARGRGAGGVAPDAENGTADDAGPADTGDAAEGDGDAHRFDPRLADPAILARVLGPRVTGVLEAFYRAGS